MRMTEAGGLAALAVAGLCGCAGAPKSSGFVAPDVHPALAKGARVVVDACVQRRVLVGANHFVVAASEAAARSIEGHTRAHFARRALAAPGESALSVCGVLNDPESPQKTFADQPDGPTAKQAPPLKLSPALAGLGEHLLAVPSLFAELQRAAQQHGAAAARDSGTAPPATVLTPAARAAAAAIAAPQDMLLFVGLQGNSESGGKIAAQMTAIIGLSVAASVAAAPAAMTFTGPTAAQIAATQATAAVGVQFLSVDGWLLSGALVDTRDGRVLWGGTVGAASDPIKPESLGRGMTTERLLRTLLNQPDAAWSPPGRAAGIAKASR
jgi:hypothetical protein